MRGYCRPPKTQAFGILADLKLVAVISHTSRLMAFSDGPSRIVDLGPLWRIL